MADRQFHDGAASWPDRLRRAAIVLLAAVMVFAALAASGTLQWTLAVLGFVAIVAAALVPWHLHNASPFDDAGKPLDPVDAEAARALVTGMPDPAVLLDRAGRVLLFNPAAGELAPALRRGEPAQSALRTPEVVATLRQALSDGSTQRVVYVERGPIERWLELIVTPVVVPRHFEGRDTVMLMTFHDHTPLRRAEELRADFVANASHELRTPLAALSGFIDTLRGPAKDDAKARERFLGIMHQQATRMARLIDDLLSLSRIELGAHLRPETPADLVQIIRQVVDGLESLARERGVVVTLEVPSAPVIVPGDRDELLRLFENLIENGLKYGASGGRVDIAISTAEATPGGASEARVRVRDHGPGIAPEHLPRLTERFYRVDVGDSRAQGGTGLGLSLVKHILNRHRGRLLIESTPGQGAAFTACLPTAVKPQAAA